MAPQVQGSAGSHVGLPPLSKSRQAQPPPRPSLSLPGPISDGSSPQLDRAFLLNSPLRVLLDLATPTRLVSFAPSVSPSSSNIYSSRPPWHPLPFLSGHFSQRLWSSSPPQPSIRISTHPIHVEFSIVSYPPGTGHVQQLQLTYGDSGTFESSV